VFVKRCAVEDETENKGEINEWDSGKDEKAMLGSDGQQVELQSE
jgi:hypothetical protein